MTDDTSVSFWWILLFVLLTLGVGAGAILFVGGDLLGASLFVVAGQSIRGVFEE